MTDRREKGVVDLAITAVRVGPPEEPLVLLMFENITDLVKIRDFLPICSGCKKIRTDTQHWETLERYFKENLDLDFSHGMCPDCVERFYPGLDRSPRPKQ